MNKIKNAYIQLPIQIKASIWFLVCSVLQKGISVITTPLFTRILTSIEYGQYSSFNSWLDIVTIIVTMCMYYGVYTQGLVKFETERSVFSSSIQGLVLSLSIFWTVIYLAFHRYINAIIGFSTPQMLLMLILIWTTSAFNFWSAEQRVQYKYKALVALTLLVSVAKPVFSIILIFSFDDKVLARILGIALAEIIGYSGLFVIQMKKGKVFFSKKYWKYILSFSIPLIPHYFSQTLLNSSDRIMIQKLVGDSETGYYALAYSLSQIMLLFNTALLQTINPWIYQKIKERHLGDISKVAYPALIIIASVNIILLTFAPEAISIFAPKEYSQAVAIIPPVAMSGYFMFAYSLFADFEFYYEKTHYITIATVICAIANVGLNYVFINIFGYMAAGYTTLFCYILYAVFHYIAMKKICKKEFPDQSVYNLKIIIVITISFIVLGFAFALSYLWLPARIALVIVILLVSILKRKVIIETLKSIIGLRKKVNA